MVSSQRGGRRECLWWRGGSGNLRSPLECVCLGLGKPTSPASTRRASSNAAGMLRQIGWPRTGPASPSPRVATRPRWHPAMSSATSSIRAADGRPSRAAFMRHRQSPLCCAIIGEDNSSITVHGPFNLAKNLASSLWGWWPQEWLKMLGSAGRGPPPALAVGT